MKWFLKYGRYIIALGLVCAFFNIYFLYLLPNVSLHYLFYADIVLGVCLMIFLIVEYRRERQKEQKKQDYMTSSEVIAGELEDYDNIEIAYHDNEVLNQQLEKQYQINNDLQDYMTKWCHEVKIPLSVSLLMNEKIIDPSLKKDMQEQLEKINQYLNSVLIGCRVQSQLYDLYIQQVDLKACVHRSIKNNRFFLIKNHFEIDLHIDDVRVYSDVTWLTYIFDQLINNSIKYARQNPYLKIWSEVSSTCIGVYIEDHGEGIASIDLPYIFEKGFTGHNHHNGQYKSTGMGLYMVDKMIKKLGHRITVESQQGCYTRFHILFLDNRDYFNLS